MIYVDKNITASMDVDAQRGFTPLCPDELPIENGNFIVDECNKSAEKAKFRYMSKDAHSPNALWVANEKNPQFSKIEGHDNLDIRWNSHCNVGTDGFELIYGLPHPSEYDFLVYKGVEKDMHPYSPVYHDAAKKISTGLIEKAISDGVKTFIINGLALNFEDNPLCVGHTLIDLSKAGFRVILNLGATRGIGKSGNFINSLKKDYNIKVVNSADEIEIK